MSVPLHVAGVFQDETWARRGLAAMAVAGFAPDAISVLRRDDGRQPGLRADESGPALRHLRVAVLGDVLARGPLVNVLNGDDDGLETLGLSGTARRAGFQPNDGRIFETLVERGGVLVAVTTEPRAGDALALLHSYGAGNAAIGAWIGR